MNNEPLRAIADDLTKVYEEQGQEEPKATLAAYIAATYGQLPDPAEDLPQYQEILDGATKTAEYLRRIAELLAEVGLNSVTRAYAEEALKIQQSFSAVTTFLSSAPEKTLAYAAELQTYRDAASCLLSRVEKKGESVQKSAILEKALAPFQSFWMIALVIGIAAVIGSQFDTGENGAALGWIIGAGACYIGALFTARLVGPLFFNRNHLIAKVLLTLVTLALMVVLAYLGALVMIGLLFLMSFILISIGAAFRRMFHGGK